MLATIALGAAQVWFFPNFQTEASQFHILLYINHSSSPPSFLQSPWGVAGGAIAGHLLATSIAILGGAFLANHISEKLVKATNCYLRLRTVAFWYLCNSLNPQSGWLFGRSTVPSLCCGHILWSFLTKSSQATGERRTDGEVSIRRTLPSTAQTELLAKAKR